ncbi:hypothetical protein GJ697_01510 [Pseudoduganella sp. FT25W]|uniref:Chromosome partition protein MukB n=1 Tax=Duganella alba TaxID=2666081 RepID=A0A6L5QA26_9BURK|nr:SbcC/MukB-like Walker B domain-containing protein [Duganella alba]MRX06509.1 hypothetical protein [Duganella alba]MRX14903.1 hypothetical protein [Duganella alba]
MKLYRTYARRLVIANWKGIVFHCFDLDRHVTGLEGQNGSGKTTVMAAFVTAILPNLGLLEFKNINGAAAPTRGDRGLWGRLGEQGISYAVIEWITPRGKSIWAGVALLRGAMPSIDIRSFIIEDAPAEASPYELLLVRDGERSVIPQLNALRDHVNFRGGRMTVCKTLNEYMKSLFDLGITPLPMATHEEQERYYRVLSTSMQGSALASLIQTGLRDYLLLEDATLERRTVLMRDALQQCRITRGQLDEAEKAHGEISGLFDAAWKMTSFALFGALGRYEQELGNWRQQATLAKTLRSRHARDVQAVAGLQELVASLTQQLSTAQEQGEMANADLRDKEQAHDLRRQLEAATEDHAELTKSAEKAQLECEQYEHAERQAMAVQQHAEDEHTRLAEELGNTQQAYEGLIRRVTALRIARDRWAEAQAVMVPLRVDRHTAAAIKLGVDAQYEAATVSQTDAQARFDAFDRQRVRFESLHSQIGMLARAQSQTPPAAHRAHAYAVALEVKLRNQQAAAEAIATLEHDLAFARHAATEQRAVRAQAEELGIQNGAELSSAQDVVHAELAQYEAEQNTLGIELAARQQRLLEAQGKLPALQEALRCYQLACNFHAELAALEPVWSALASADDVQRMAELKRHEQTAVQEHRAAAERDLQLLRKRLGQLESNTGALDPRIATVAAHVDGALLAQRYDDLAAAEAATTEARLGILADAIVVDQPAHAARLASELGDRPDTLLFISEQLARQAADAVSLDDSELVTEGRATQLLARLTRRPERPVLGRRARQLEIARLTNEVATLEVALAGLHGQARMLQRSLGLASDWMALGNSAWEADPEPAYHALQVEVRAQGQAIAGLQARGDSLRERAARANHRRGRLGELASRRNLLDPPLFAQTVVQLERELQTAQSARVWLRQHGAAVQLILAELPLLAVVPEPGQQQVLAQQMARLMSSRAYLARQRDALQGLLSVIDHLDRDEDERQYHQQGSVIEALKRQLAPAKAQLDASRKQLKEAQDLARAAQQAQLLQQADLRQKQTQCQSLQLSLAATGATGTDEELALARSSLERIREQQARLAPAREAANKRHIEAATLLGRLGGEMAEQNKAASQQLSVLRGERQARRELRHAVAELGLHGKIDTPANRQKYLPPGSPINAFHASQEQQGVLLERLKPYPEVLEKVKRIEGFSEDAGKRRAIQTLHAWERVRLHIEQRIPRTIATADDPQLALAQMTEKLGELRRTLLTQEQDMRNRSSGLADGISVRLRSARALVNRLSHELEQVSFGSIQGLSIKSSQPEDMESMLNCLRQHNQLSLFDSGLPLEETLAHMYHRETGGTIKGTKLLDYRNYLRLHLEVRRLNGRWEATDGLSTGEAIGVGAAVLIMILRTWNDEANRLSGAAGYAMQQILLDEANRLDQAALDTLTEFCQRMDVQALVAAPGLDKPRRSTVFQLQRSLRGKEEYVTIRGTRMSA